MKVFSLPFLTLVLLLSYAFPGRAQKVWQEEIIKIYDGLPSDIVLKTHTEEKGFLYVSTQKGLSRYDGYHFINHRDIHSPVNSFYYKDNRFYVYDAAGLSVLRSIGDKPKVIVPNNYEDVDPNNDHYDNLFVDSRLRIWCSDFNYIKYFSEKNKETQRFRVFLSNKAEDEAVVFMEPKPGEVWAFTKKGLFVWSEKTKKMIPHSSDVIGRESFRTAILLDKSTILMVTTSGKLWNYDIEGNLVKQVFDVPNDEPFTGGGFYREGKTKIPFFYGHQKIFAFNNGKFSELYKIQKAQINHVFADSLSGMLWISSTKGLVKLSKTDAISNHEIPQKSSTHNPVISIGQDQNKTIWILAKNSQLWSYNLQNIWKRMATPAGNPKFTSIDIFENQVFLSSDQGLFAVANGEIKKLSLPDLPKNSLIKKTILTKNRELWLLCAGIAIQRYHWPSLKKITLPFENPQNYWTENTWNDIIENSDGLIWMAGWAPKDYGMHFYNPLANKFIDNSDLEFNRNRNVFFGDYNTRIGLGKNKSLLFSGYGGFNRVASNGKITQKIDVLQYPIANGRIEGIAEDNQGNVVFATADGLHLYSSANDKVIRISQIDGLPSDDLVYGFKKCADGKFAIGTDNAFVIVDVEKLIRPKQTNRLELSSVKIDGMFGNSNGNRIELSEDETDLSLNFSTLAFTDKQKIFYRYKFKEDKHWNNLGNTPELSLNHITPGNYSLIVESGNHLGQWDSKKLGLLIVAHPPFYRSNWFYALLLCVIIGNVIGINRYLLLRQRKEADYRQKLKEAEMLTLRTQMNPHFMFNTLNSINSFIIENKREAASGYLTTFSKLMRSILEFSQESVISLDDEIRTLGLYLELEAVRLEHSFDYTIKVDKELKDELIRIPPLILQPFVENAIWHGLRHKQEQGNLYISFRKQDDKYLKIRIEDDGIGRKAAAEIKKNQNSHKSYGIGITIERLSMLDPENTVNIIDLNDGKGQATGTAVEITITI